MSGGSIHEALLRRHLAALPPYQPILPFEVLSEQLSRPSAQIVKLDANENPYGPLPEARAALAGHPYLHIYPDPEQRELRAALGEYVGVDPESILVTHGADELIDLLCRLFLGPADLMIDCPPTFGMYRFDAQLAGATVVDVARRDDFSLDAAAVVRAVVGESGTGSRPKLLFLASPNNPDGGVVEPTTLQQILALPVMVVLDEAYIEFAGLAGSVASWVKEHNNLVVLRTFSKWAGLAGMRLGYGILPPWLMEVALRAKQPYNVSVAAAAAGLASLRGREHLKPSLDAIVRERERLVLALGSFAFLEPLPSRANFVLCRVIGCRAQALHQALAAQGVLVRHYATGRLADYLRVSAGRPEDSDALLSALAWIAEEQGSTLFKMGGGNA